MSFTLISAFLSHLQELLFNGKLTHLSDDEKSLVKEILSSLIDKL